jgi:hypothetical protein
LSRSRPLIDLAIDVELERWRQVVDHISGQVNATLDQAEPEELSELYASLRLSLTYLHIEQIVDPLVDRVDKLRVRGGTRTLTTRLDLDPQPLGPTTPNTSRRQVGA